MRHESLFGCLAAALFLAGCSGGGQLDAISPTHAVCTQGPLPDATRVQAAVAESSGSGTSAKAEHRVGGGVEVFVYSHLQNQGDFDVANDAEKARYLLAIAPGMPNKCPPQQKVEIARVWEVAGGAFTRPSVSEKLVLVRIDRCGSPGDASHVIGILDAAGSVVFRQQLPGATTLVSAPDPFGEGRRYLVLATETGESPQKQVRAKIARVEGDRLAILGESEPMDPECRSAATAPWFFAVLWPGKPTEFRTAKGGIRCPR